MNPKIKTLVVVGCSLTYGQGVEYDETWGYKLANELELNYINLGCGGTGWYYVEGMVTQFVTNNLDNIDEYLFIIQKSEFTRKPHMEEIPIFPINNDLQNYGINFLSREPSHFLSEDTTNRNCTPTINSIRDKYTYDVDDLKLPTHRTEVNFRNQWWIPIGNDRGESPHFHGQSEQLMLHWAYRAHSLHSLLKSFNVPHLFVDGYYPLFSNKLQFRKYDGVPQTSYDLELGFWSTDILPNDERQNYLYEWNNKKVSKIMDNISIKNKIDDCVLWGTFFWEQANSEWNLDGGHPGPKGHTLIKDILKQNLSEKGYE